MSLPDTRKLKMMQKAKFGDKLKMFSKIKLHTPLPKKDALREYLKNV